MKQIPAIFTSVFIFVSLSCQSDRISKETESKLLTLDFTDMRIVGEVNERYQSFNVEMCEVVGGDFWIPYELMDSALANTNSISNLHRTIPPVDLYEKKSVHLPQH